MGFYKAKIEEYKAKAQEGGLTLQDRMFAVKKTIEEDLKRQHDEAHAAYFFDLENTAQRNEGLAQDLREAQKIWSSVVLQTPEQFFGDWARAELEGVWVHKDKSAEACSQTYQKISKVEDGVGFVGTVGRVIGGVKTMALNSLNTTLSEQQEELNGVFDAAKEFTDLNMDEKLEYVVGKYEQTGMVGYNPQEVIDFYKQNPVEAVSATPLEQ